MDKFSLFKVHRSLRPQLQNGNTLTDYKVYLFTFFSLNVWILNAFISSVLYNLTATIRGRKLCTCLMTAFHFYSFLGILSPKTHSERVEILSDKDFAKWRSKTCSFKRPWFNIEVDGAQGIFVGGFNFFIYRIIASSNTSHLEAHPGIFTLLLKGIFDAYLLWPFDKNVTIS